MQAVPGAGVGGLSPTPCGAIPSESLLEDGTHALFVLIVRQIRCDRALCLGDKKPSGFK